MEMRYQLELSVVFLYCVLILESLVCSFYYCQKH